MRRREIEGFLPVGDLGRRFELHEVVDSTNLLATRRLAEGRVGDGDLFCALEQTAGRGTKGRRWLAEPGSSLLATIVLTAPPTPRPLSFWPAVALARTLRELGAAAVLDWPNDVMVAGRKIAGILVESIVQGEQRCHLVGLGVNVRQRSFPAELRDEATSLALLGREVEVAEVLRRLLEHLAATRRDGEELVAAWAALSEMIGRRYRARRSGIETVVTIEGLDAEGHLLVRGEDGRPETWVSASDLDIDRRPLPESPR